MSVRHPLLLGAGVLAATLVAPLAARAEDVACSTLPNAIYGIGGSAQKPLLAQVAKRLRSIPEPITLIYQSPGACFGIQALTGEKPPIKGTTNYWEADGTEKLCTLPVDGIAADYAVMGVFAESCPGIENVTGVGTFPFGVIGWNFLVPQASSQQSISAEAAYFVLGFGNQGQAEPWTDESAIIVRNPTSAAGLAIGAAVGVPPERFRGVDAGSNGRTVTLLTGATDKEKAIGFASGEFADSKRADVRTLAYQHRGQQYAYWPDSTATSFDKLNLREGRYFLWSQQHVFAPVNAQGVATNPEVARFIGYLTLALESPAGLPALDVLIETGNIPECAMHVWRDHDFGPLESHQPEEPCGCYFDFKATGATSCTACDENSDCPTTSPVCRHGYCEVK